MDEITLEICCGSAGDAVEAKKAGAPRVELCSALFLGGLTPSIGEVLVAKKCGVSVMAMVRPREGGFCYTDVEFETMLADARAMLDAGADGIVFGVLRPDGTVDEARCRALVELAGERETVFHRAVDVTPDWRAAMDTLMELGVTRILTSGQQASVPLGLETVKAMREYGAGRIQVMPGGGVKLRNAREILAYTGCSQVHASLKKTCLDRSAAGNPDIHFGGALYPPDDCYTLADGEKIAALLARLGDESPDLRQ